MTAWAPIVDFTFHSFLFFISILMTFRLHTSQAQQIFLELSSGLEVMQMALFCFLLPCAQFKSKPFCPGSYPLLKKFKPMSYLSTFLYSSFERFLRSLATFETHVSYISSNPPWSSFFQFFKLYGLELVISSIPTLSKTCLLKLQYSFP